MSISQVRIWSVRLKSLDNIGCASCCRIVCRLVIVSAEHEGRYGKGPQPQRRIGPNQLPLRRRREPPEVPTCDHTAT